MTLLVAGGSRGIGRAIALGFAAPGEHVLINYLRDDASARDVATEIQAAGAAVQVVKGDISTPAGAAAVAEEVGRHCDRLDQVVHSVCSTIGGSLLDTDPQDLMRAVEVNGMSLLYLTQAVLPLLDTGSSLFYLTSRGGRDVLPGYGPLGIGKALAESAIRYLAADLASRGIRANAIDAGPLDTDAYRAMLGPHAVAHLASTANKTIGGEGLRFEDVVALIRFLSSP